MANKKFSQFTLGTTHTDIEYVVGYKSTDNVQVVPSALDSTYELNPSVVQGGADINLEGASGPDTGNIFGVQFLGGDHIDVSLSGTEITVANTQKNTFVVTGTFQNLFGGSPGIFGDTLEFGVKAVPADSSSSVFVAPFDCEIVSIAVKYISQDSVLINAGSSWQVKIFKMSSPLGSTNDTSNYSSGVDIPGILLQSTDSGTYPLKTASGFTDPVFSLNAGDVINISGVETGTIAQSDAEMEVFIGIRAK